MSGIETVKIIVDAEREAARILQDAADKASEIRKRLASLIRKQHEDIVAGAKKEAASLIQDAEAKAKTEASIYEKEAEQRVLQGLATASSKKDNAVAKAVEVVLEMKA